MRRPIRNLFTVVFCATCPAESDPELVDTLRASIRRCPYAMLVNADCVPIAMVCDWLEQGRWNRDDLPSRLRAELPAAALAQRN